MTRTNSIMQQSIIIQKHYNMYTKSILSLIFVVLLLISYSIYIGTVDLRSRLQPVAAPPPRTRCATTTGPLKVFLYDLPRRFNVGMLDHNKSLSDDLRVTNRNLPPWPRSWGLRKQHSVEYWLMASLLYYDGGGDGEMEVVRVLDPDLADVFFVPFFSSLSFNTHGHVMTDPETEIDRQLQVDLLEFLRQSTYWLRSGGRDHVIPMTHPNAFRFLREQVNASMLVVVDFGRYNRTTSYLRKDVVSPYVHIVESFKDDDGPDPFESRPTLLFFRGNTVRKDEGKIRAELVKILAGYDDVIYERSSATTKTIKETTKGIRSSKFCLNPAGDTPSSCRLFDAIVSHCVPVIVSDQIELPFEDTIDYTEFSVFFSVKEALKPGYMVDELRKISKQRWMKMWMRLKDVAHHYEFQYPPLKDDAVNMIWREVKHKLPAAELAVHRSRRLKIPDWW